MSSSYWGILVFKVCLCVKLFGDSGFQGLFVHEAIGGFHFSGFVCASSYWGILLLVVLVLVVLLLLLVVPLLLLVLVLIP